MVLISRPQPSVVFKEVVLEPGQALFRSAPTTSRFFTGGTEQRCVFDAGLSSAYTSFCAAALGSGPRAPKTAFFKVRISKPCYYGSCPAKASVAFLCLLASPEGPVAQRAQSATKGRGLRR